MNRETLRELLAQLLRNYQLDLFEEEAGLDHEETKVLASLPWTAHRLEISRYGSDTRWLNTWKKAFHGTDLKGVTGIVGQGFKLEHSKRGLYGDGIYATPDFGVAAAYAMQKVFSHKGKQYLAVVEIRIDPDKMEVKVPKDFPNTKYYIVKSEDGIRPTAIILHELTDKK